MKHGALVNPLAYDDPAAFGRVTEAELLGTIAERDSAPVPLYPPLPAEACTELGAHAGQPAAPDLWDRYPRALPAAVLSAFLIVWGAVGHDEHHAEADAAALADELAAADTAWMAAHAPSEPRP